MGLLTDRINNKLEKYNLINEHALNPEPVPFNLGIQVISLHVLNKQIQLVIRTGLEPLECNSATVTDGSLRVVTDVIYTPS